MAGEDPWVIPHSAIITMDSMLDRCYTPAQSNILG